ncbi:hypothetical protein Tco_0289948 [Tanacetum coccineum]
MNSLKGTVDPTCFHKKTSAKIFSRPLITQVAKILDEVLLDVCNYWETYLLAGHQKGRKALRYPVRKLNILLCLAVVLKSLSMRSHLTDIWPWISLKFQCTRDNKSSIAISATMFNILRSKHIYTSDFYFIKEQVENGVEEFLLWVQHGVSTSRHLS